MKLALKASLVAVLTVSAATEAANWKHPKTSWGDPDLQGTWPIVHLISVPLERPTQYGDRLHFNEAELAEQKTKVETRNKRYQDEDSSDRIGQGAGSAPLESKPDRSDRSASNQ